MTNRRMAEATINASLDAHLHGAQEGDAGHARQLHDLLDRMLTGQELPEGVLWLTDHGKMLMAQMHRELGHCESSGDQLRDQVLSAVQFKPHAGHWEDSCSFVHDLRVAMTVANELCVQRDAGKEPNVTEAAATAAEGGEFGLDAGQLAEVYEKVAATVGGFREISRC
ncbi:hypothetical protein ACFL07_04410 [Pseudomonadota bacterium]